MSEHVEKIKAKVEDLHSVLDRSASSDRRDALLKIIHRPGWTTPAEALLVHNIIDNLTAHLKLVDTMHAQLLEVAEQVGKGGH